MTFLPSGRVVEARRGETILEAAGRGGVFLAGPCGGRQACGKCRVRVADGTVRTEPSLHACPGDIERGWVLACHAVPEGDVRVEIPPESRGPSGPLEASGSAELRRRPAFDPGPLPYLAGDPLFPQSPLATRAFCVLPEPEGADAVSDLDRVIRGLRESRGLDGIEAGIEAVRTLPGGLREKGFAFTVTLAKRGPRSAEILSVDPGDLSGANWGAAVDLGTTNVALHLLELGEGRTVGTAGVPNGQARFGADVITRVLHAGRPGGLVELQEAAAADINRCLASACREAGVPPGEVTCVQVAANPIMTQILLRVDPSNLRRAPFAATANAFAPVLAADLGIRIHPRGRVHAAPGVSSYVGGDTTAGVAACGMAVRDEISLLVDLGTNGEMVLGNREWLACTSCSVGPAFEGSGISCGVRACPGAVEEAEVDDRGETARLRTVGDAPPCGICGSGLIDLFAGLLDAGVVDRAGRLQADAAPSRVRRGPEGLEYVVSPGPGRGLFLTQPDLDNLLRSKAAVYAASMLLVRRMGFEFDRVDRIYVAGGFGNRLDVEKAVRIGLLPDQPREKFVWIGNSSLAGAKMLLRYDAARAHAEEVAAKMAYVELSGDNAYTEEFVSALFLPHTDLARFPSAGKNAGPPPR